MYTIGGCELSIVHNLATQSEYMLLDDRGRTVFKLFVSSLDTVGSDLFTYDSGLRSQFKHSFIIDIDTWYSLERLNKLLMLKF